MLKKITKERPKERWFFQTKIKKEHLLRYGNKNLFKTINKSLFPKKIRKNRCSSKYEKTNCHIKLRIWKIVIASLKL
jgi:hypothetical protein